MLRPCYLRRDPPGRPPTMGHEFDRTRSDPDDPKFQRVLIMLSRLGSVDLLITNPTQDLAESITSSTWVYRKRQNVPFRDRKTQPIRNQNLKQVATAGREGMGIHPFDLLGLPFCPGLYGLAASSQTKDGQRMCPPPGPKNPMGYKHLSATRPARCISILMRLSEPASQSGKRRPDSTRQEINQLRLHFDFVEVTRSLHLLLARYTEDSIGQRH